MIIDLDIREIDALLVYHAIIGSAWDAERSKRLKELADALVAATPESYKEPEVK